MKDDPKIQLPLAMAHWHRRRVTDGQSRFTKLSSRSTATARYAELQSGACDVEFTDI